MSAYTEQGIQVYKVSDYEWVAGADPETALAYACEQWGYTVALAKEEELFDDDYTNPCDLDVNKVNVAEEGEERLITYREELKILIARGSTFPLFFAGID